MCNAHKWVPHDLLQMVIFLPDPIKAVSMFYNLDTLQKQNQANFDMAVKSYEALTKGVQEISKETTEFSKKYIENSTSAWEKVSAAKSVDKAVEAQSEFAKGAYEAFVAQGTKIGQIYTDMAKDAYKPFEKAAAPSAK